MNRFRLSLHSLSFFTRRLHRSVLLLCHNYLWYFFIRNQLFLIANALIITHILNTNFRGLLRFLNSSIINSIYSIKTVEIMVDTIRIITGLQFFRTKRTHVLWFILLQWRWFPLLSLAKKLLLPETLLWALMRQFWTFSHFCCQINYNI